VTRRLLALALLLLVAAPAFAATGTAGTTRPRARTSALAPARSAAPAASARAGRTGGAARTLEDIHIEGEIPVPQVLFITARDQRRFVEFQHQRYLRTSRQLAEATLPPGWIVVSRSPITPAEEISR
jgi:hypothetical protein